MLVFQVELEKYKNAFKNLVAMGLLIKEQKLSSLQLAAAI